MWRAALIVALLAPGAARAQAYDPSYAIELYSSPIIAPTNVMGRGGTTLAIADGVGSVVFQPAAVASRLPHNGNEWFDWDWSIDFMSVGFAADLDIENSGRPKSDADSIHLVNLSFGLMFGRLGLGVSAGLKNFLMCLDAQAATCDAAEQMNYTSVLNTTAVAYNFLDGQLVVGVEGTTPAANFASGAEAGQHKFIGAALGAGVIVRPHDRPFRVGFSARGPITSERSDKGDGETLAGRLLPDRLVVPWHVGLGVAYGFGSRALNMRGSFGDSSLSGEALEVGRRGYNLVSVDLMLVGPTERAVGGASWLAQEVDRAGESITLSPRLGWESELWDNFLRVRAGTYFEPSRFTGHTGRLHATAGLDLNMFEVIWEWRLTSAIDVARDFANVSLGLGFWH